MMSTWVFDTETLPNRTLFSAKCVETKERFDIWRHEENSVGTLLNFISTENKTFVGFNSIYFDSVIVSAFCAGRKEIEIKRIADDLIVNRTPYWEAYKKYLLRKYIKGMIQLLFIGVTYFLGAMVIFIFLPSMEGMCSTLPYSSRS